MYTTEQSAIIDSTAKRIRVLAFAGTGKTTTLVGYARARTAKMLYVAYNKAIQLEATRKFPTNVVCRTAHSLAYAVFGRPYAHKLGNMRVGDVAETLRLSYPQAAMVLTTVNNYFNSADDRIGTAHLPSDANRNNAMEIHNVISGAELLWRDMRDLDKPSCPLPHDGYLKLYALSRPTLPTEVVLFDEAQDANPVISSIVLGHPGPLCITGDSHQSIYQWRGAKDCLADLQGAETYALTKSFRFGRGIAGVANHLLGYLGESRQIEGAGQYAESRMEIDRSRPFAVVARTNMSIIQAAIETLQHRLRSFYVGGVENVKLSLINDGYLLYCGNKSRVQDRFIQKFSSLSALSEYATQAKDSEMGLLVKLVSTYTHAIPGLLDDIRKFAVDDQGAAQRIFTTAHRSKGLEFDQCLLCDDFADLLSEGRPIPLKDIDTQEVNLHYVAATRAIEALEVGAQLRQFVRVVERTGPLVVPVDPQPSADVRAAGHRRFASHDLG